MSATQYYWCVGTCPHCNRSDRFLIGNLYDNYSFVLEEYPCAWSERRLPRIDVKVSTWSDWTKIVVRAPEDMNDPLYRVPWGHIENGDGDVIAPDEFEHIVESAPGGIFIYDGFGEYKATDVK